MANSLELLKPRAIAAVQASSAVVGDLVLVAVPLKASIGEVVQLALRVNVDKRAVEVAEGDRAVAADAAGNGIVSDHSKRRSS